MRSSWGKLALLLAVVRMTMATCAAQVPVDFKETPWSQLSDRNVSDWGQAALAVGADRWVHGETAHFIIHCYRDGDRIATRSESFYEEIREFFGNRPDLLTPRKSHIFAFREMTEWRAFCRSTGILFAIGLTRGNEFFYLSTGEDGHFDSKGKVQAHEMTHLVFNRFFRGRPPLWLNEGVAEYFGQRKTTSLMDFRHTMGRTPKYSLDRLFSTAQYPSDPLEIQAFYSEAAIVVDFLTYSEDRSALLPRFVDAMIGENDVAKALTIYGYKDLAEFEEDYRRYRHRF